MKLQEFLKPTAKTGEMATFFNLQSVSTNHESWFEHIAEWSSNAEKLFVFHSVVFAATVRGQQKGF